MNEIERIGHQSRMRNAGASQPARACMRSFMQMEAMIITMKIAQIAAGPTLASPCPLR
jgi:hypothetical protein